MKNFVNTYTQQRMGAKTRSIRGSTWQKTWDLTNNDMKIRRSLGGLWGAARRATYDVIDDTNAKFY